MRRLLVGLLAFLGLSATMLTLPVWAAPGPEAEPVETSTDEIAMGSVTHPARAADVQDGTTDPVPGVADDAPTLTITKTHVDEFSLVGVTWEYDAEVTDTLIQVRVQGASGDWGAWTEVGLEDAEQNPNADSGQDLRGGTAPLWTGPSTGVEVELVTRSGARPTDVQLDLVDPGESEADGALESPEITDTAGAALAMPPVYSRAQWGADEGIRTWDPEYASTIKAATLHHTADTNNYGPDQVPAMMRSIYRYHTVSRGWGDIGYNVIVDKFGRLWEGRYGGLASTVIGAHAGGFNTSTFGVSMLGNYDQVTAPQPMIDSVSAIIAWKLFLYGVDPNGRTTLTSGGGGTSRYARGVQVNLPTIFGHRDVGSTSCPGQYGYARLPEIRSSVAARIAAAPSIAKRYAADAALRSRLGAPIGTQRVSAGVISQAYANGQMYDSWDGGVHFVVGDILGRYLAVGGPSALGGPATDELATPDRVGRFSHFTNWASIYWTPQLGAHLVRGDIRELWAAQGWEAGPLGYPTTDELPARDGSTRYSTFQNGTIVWTPSGRARSLYGPTEDKWLAAGGLTWSRGLPTTSTTATPGGAGRYTHFANSASIYWTAGTGAHIVQGGIRTKWASLGWEKGPLGYPTSDELVAADGTTRYTTFQNGTVLWTKSGGARALYGQTEDKWLAAGGLTWSRGLPTTSTTPTPDGAGTYTHFADFASIYWTAGTGAHIVQGGIRELWGALGWEKGPLGYPTSDELVAADGTTRYTTFQNGTIVWTPSGGARAVHGPVEDAWQALGGLTSPSGLPLNSTTATPDRAGAFNHFSDGSSIYWTSGTGAHLVRPAVRAVWRSLQWERGPLGYPTADPVTGPDGYSRVTAFQGGVVYENPGRTGTHAVHGDIATTYLGMGGPSSALGLPTSDQYGVPDGAAVDFEHGTLTWNSRTRVVTVTLI